MARTVAPLLSWGASGKIADTQVYSKWKGRPYVRRYVIPANPDSPAQQLTRNTFRFLNNLYKYMPAGATGAWNLYADNSRITARNAWLKQNVGPLRTETDLTDILLSVAAGSGIVAATAPVTPGTGTLTVAPTAPALPTGWSITRAWGMAVRSVDPQTSDVYQVVAGSDDTSTYSIVLSGLTASVDYVVGAWFEYEKPDGSTAYGPSLQTVAQPT